MPEQCAVATGIRRIRRPNGDVDEYYTICSRSARVFVVVGRNGNNPRITPMCTSCARAFGDRWLVFTKEYWEARQR